MFNRPWIVGWSVVYFVVASLVVLPAPTSAGKPAPPKPLPNVRYTLRFIGNSAIQPTGLVSRVNDRNEIVGNARFADSTIGPYLYDANLDLLNLPCLFKLDDLIVNDVVTDPLSGTIYERHLQEFYGNNNMQDCINNAGQVTARARVTVTDPINGTSYYGEACRLTPDQLGNFTYESLGNFDPVSINDDGVVAGWTGWTVCVCRQPGVVESIGNYLADGSRPSAISGSNPEGDCHIVGWSSNSGAWIWHPDGTWTQPDFQPTKSAGNAGQVNGTAIGDDGRLLATGSANISRGGGHAFRYTEGVAMEDLGSLAGNTSNSWDFDSSYGNAISTLGRVVGDSYIGSGAAYRAFLYYDSTSGMTNLDKVIDTFASSGDRNAWNSTSTNTSATGINAADWISGQGSFSGVYRAWVLVPHAPGP